MRTVAIALCVLLLVVVALAQEGGSGRRNPADAKPAQAAKKARTMKDRVWTQGKIVCIGCTLTAEYGVDSQCTLHAKHAQGFLSSDGKLWTLVDNSRGHRVITNPRLLGKDVKVYGWKFKKHQYLELWRYSLEKGDRWIDYDYCKT